MWANVAYGACGLIGILMLTIPPKRSPKIAAILLTIAGFGVAGWVGGLLTGVLGFGEATLSGAIGVSVVSLLFLGGLYYWLNTLVPKMGKVAGGQAKTGTAVVGFLLPTLAAVAGGSLAGIFLDIGGRVGAAVTQLTGSGF